MRISEYLSSIGFDFMSVLIVIIEIFILSACLGFFTRILKSILGKKIDKIFAYLFTIIFYIYAGLKGINIFIKSFEIFFSDGNFFLKILYYLFSMASVVVGMFLLLNCYKIIVQIFFFCSNTKDDEPYNIIAFSFEKSIFLISISSLILTISLIIGVLKSSFISGGLILKIFIGFIFLAILLGIAINFIEYIKRFHKGKEKFLLKGFFLDGNNEKSFFKFVVRCTNKKNRIFIHYQEYMSERKMGIDFYIDKKNICEIFYGNTNTIFSSIFFEENQNLNNNKIFKLSFLIPKKNVIAFYYKDKCNHYENKNILSYSNIEINYQPYLFLTKLLNNYGQIKLDFLYLESYIPNKQEFFIEEYGEIKKITRSFNKLNDFFSNYFD